MKTLILAVMVFAGAVSAAQAVQPFYDDMDHVNGMRHPHFPYHTPVMDKLESIATGDCPADKCFDGSPILRREGPLVILEEKKIGHTNRHVFHGGREGGIDVREATDIYRQKVGIADRKEYVNNERNGGRLGGGLIGLVGLLGFLAGPLVGLGILAATMTTGVVVGGNKAAAKAEAQPNVFERVTSYEI